MSFADNRLQILIWVPKGYKYATKRIKAASDRKRINMRLDHEAQTDYTFAKGHFNPQGKEIIMSRFGTPYYECLFLICSVLARMLKGQKDGGD